MTGFNEEFRRVQVAPRSAGNTVPSTNASQRDATTATDQGLVQGGGGSGQNVYPDRTARGPAMRASANDFAWRAQDRSEVKAYRETYQNLGTIDANGTATLNPNIATNFIVRAGGNLTIAVTAAEAAPDYDPHADPQQYLVGVKLWIYRPKNAVVTWSGVKWSKDVTDPAGDGSKPSLLAAAAADGYDSFVLVVIPGFGTFGYFAGRAYT